ncbi:MAG: hypothetical protein AAF915_10105 [Cyanobacteria bacterium P01_D01_bin.50]
MKKSIFATALLINSLLMIGCNNVETANYDSNDLVTTDTYEVASTNEKSTNNSSSNSSNVNYNTITKAPVDTSSATPKPGEGQPKFATIKGIVQGDLQCYVTLTDEQGKEQEIGASFEICGKKQQFLNQKVNLSYDILNVNDCQSIEPCGKTKQVSSIVKMDVIGSSKSAKSSGDTQTLSNGEWTIKLSNYDSWDGYNGNGNVKYYGCDSKGNCIELTGGKVFCRQLICVTAWENGEYTYVIEDRITEDNDNSQASILIVRKGNKVILRLEDLKPV